MKITPEERSEVIQILCQILLSDQDYRVRMQSSESLGKLQDPKAIPALTKAASKDPAFQVRISAVEALFLICSAQNSSEDQSEMSQTNAGQSTGFQINVSGGMVNIIPLDPQK